MGQITYFNKNFRPVEGVEENGTHWHAPPQPSDKELLAERIKFHDGVDELVNKFMVEMKDD